MLMKCACVFVVLSMTSGHEEIRIIDMTHEQNEDTIYWPGNPDYNFTILFRGLNTQAGFWYESNYFGTAEHGGTHLDAPAHFAQGTWRTHNIPMDRLGGPGVIINVKDKAANDPDYRLTIDDLKDWEATHGRIPNKAVVIMNSGWGRKYPNKTEVFGTVTPNDPATFHFPGFHRDAAQWLVETRHVHVVGVDTPSTDYGRATKFEVHQVLARANVAGAENVAALDQVPESGAMIYVPALKLYDGSGGPARVFATVVEGRDTSAATCLSLAWNSVLLLVSLATTVAM